MKSSPHAIVLACPQCHSQHLIINDDNIFCEGCASNYLISNGIPIYYSGNENTPEYRNYVGYNKVAHEFNDEKRLTSANFHRLTKDFFADALNQVAFDGIVVDLGCGIGFVTQILLQTILPEQIIASDISLKMLIEYKRAYPTIRSFCNTASKIPLTDTSVMAIFSSLCDPFCNVEFFKESYRVIKQGGILAITLPCKGWEKSTRENKFISTYCLSDNSTVEVNSYLYTSEEIIDMATTAGYTCLSWGTKYGKHLFGDYVSSAILLMAQTLQTDYMDLPLIDTYIFSK